MIITLLFKTYLMVESTCQRLKPYGNDSLQKMAMIYHENSKRDD